MPAEKTLVAGGRVGRHHALPNRELRDILAHRDDIAGQLVPEHSRGHDHPGVISTAKDLNIGAARQRHFYSYENVSATNCGNGHRLYLQVFLAVEHGRHHVAIHYDHLCG